MPETWEKAWVHSSMQAASEGLHRPVPLLDKASEKTSTMRRLDAEKMIHFYVAEEGPGEENPPQDGHKCHDAGSTTFQKKGKKRSYMLCLEREGSIHMLCTWREGRRLCFRMQWATRAKQRDVRGNGARVQLQMVQEEREVDQVDVRAV